MIKEKFLQVLFWLRDHFRFLLEVVVRLSLGIVKNKQSQDSDSSEEEPDTEIDGKE